MYQCSKCHEILQSTKTGGVALDTMSYSKAVIDGFQPHQSLPLFLLASNPHCLVLVGSRNGFKRDFTIKLKQLRAFPVMVDISVKKPP